MSSNEQTPKTKLGVVPLVFVLLYLTCTSRRVEFVASPDEDLRLITSVNRSRSDPTKYLCVRFQISDAHGQTLHDVQTSVSDVMKWAIGWYDESTIVLFSSDIGTCAWKLAGGDISPIDDPLPLELIDFGDELKRRKYGRR